MTQNKKQVVNDTETTKAKIEAARELSITEKLKGFNAIHAVELYCVALNLTEEEKEEVNTILSKCAVNGKHFTYYVYTQPIIGGVKTDGTPNPTKEEWEKMNPNAIRVDVLDSKQWYKKEVFADDNLAIRRIVSNYKNYADARENGKKRLVATLMKEMGDAFLAGDMEKAEKIRTEIQKITAK